MVPKKIKAVIERFKRALKEAHFPSARIILFGSYARNEARTDSDIDLCLISSAFSSDPERFRKEATIIAYHVDPRIQVVVVDPKRLKSDQLSPLFSYIRKEGIAA